MAFRVFIIFVFAALAVAGLAIPGPLQDRLKGDDSGSIGIFIKEDDDVLALEARYPKNKSEKVNEYIKGYFGLTDISEMDGLEINQYQTPDSTMRFHLISRTRYLRIAMQKDQNGPDALDKLKAATGGLKTILTGN